MSDNSEAARELDAGSQIVLSLSHEILNFRPNFKFSLNRTYVLSPSGCSLFVLRPTRKQCYLGVPEPLFDFFLDTPWYYVAYKPNTNAFYLVFARGRDASETICALLIRARPRVIRALSSFGSVTLVRMNHYGVADAEDGAFDLSLKPIEALEWEYA